MAKLATKETSQLRIAHEESLKLVEGLRAKQQPLQVELVRLVEERDQHLIEYFAEDPAGVASYQAADARVKATEEQIATLKRAIERTEERSARAQAQRLVAENKDRIDRCLKVYDRRIQRAKEITSAIEKLKCLYDLWLDDAKKATETWPDALLQADGMGLCLDDNSVVKIFGQEIWRLTQDESNLGTIGLQFPGPISGIAELTGQPGRAGVTVQMMLPPLADRLTACRGLAEQVLTGVRTLGGQRGPNAPMSEDLPTEEMMS